MQRDGPHFMDNVNTLTIEEFGRRLRARERFEQRFEVRQPATLGIGDRRLEP